LIRRFAALVAATAAVAIAVSVPTAGAYGNKAKYQATESLNCDSKTSPFCTQVVGLGGQWQWFAFNTDGTFDATMTFCAHEGVFGAFHQNGDGIWTTGPATMPVFSAVTTDFYVSFDNGATWQDTTIPFGTGHFSAKMGPGISAEAQVTQIPGR
jgi:hypothetical protein